MFHINLRNSTAFDTGAIGVTNYDCNYN